MWIKHFFLHKAQSQGTRELQVLETMDDWEEQKQDEGIGEVEEEKAQGGFKNSLLNN